MIRDTHKTVVQFRKWKDTGEIIAIFPELPATNHPSGGCMSYMHVGQHGACGEIGHCTIATTPEEYAPLMRELESIGYNLRVVKRRTVHHQRKLYDSLVNA